MSRLKSLTLTLALALPALASAQSQDVPLRIGFQGRLLATDGTPLAGLKQVTFSIYSAPTGGTPLWSETQTLLLTNGYYATFVGATKSLGTTDNPAIKVFNGAALFLGVTVAGSAELTPRQQIGSVAYAIHSADAVHASRADQAVHADVASAVDQKWLGSQGVARADVATALSGGSVSATTVGASSVTTGSLSVSGQASAGSITASSLSVSGGSNLQTVTAGATSATSLTVSGTATLGSLNTPSLVHMPGAVVGGIVITNGSTSSSCGAWGDGVCSASGASCGGGTNHPAGYKFGTPRALSSTITLCIQE